MSEIFFKNFFLFHQYTSFVYICYYYFIEKDNILQEIFLNKKIADKTIMILSAFCHLSMLYSHIAEYARSPCSLSSRPTFSLFSSTRSFVNNLHNTHTNQCSDNRNGYCYQYTKHLCIEQVIITENKTVPFSYRINRSLCQTSLLRYRPIYRRYRDIRMRQVRHHIRILVLVQIMQSNKSG